MENLIKNGERFFIVGIKGNGTSAMASILHAQGKYVAGSDVTEDFITKPLLDAIDVHPAGFGDVTDFTSYDAVIYSTSAMPDNPDLVNARKQDIPTLSYPEALGALGSLFDTSIAVCGSHGKSTITSLLGYVLSEGGMDPTVLVGAEVVNWKSSVRAGGKKLFIFEADEYQNKFKHYFPDIIIVNNINFEHPDFFKTFEEYKKTFEDFLEKVPDSGMIVANIDHPAVNEIVKVIRKKTLWFGEQDGADMRLTNRSSNVRGQTIEINGNEQYSLSVIGKHNALNALPVIALAKHFSMDAGTITTALSSFKSTKRRLEIIGSTNDRVVIDDFAHHPTEIVASLAALKEAYPERRVIVTFQAHTFSRTEALLSDFAKAFQNVDELILIPIFASAREQKGTITTDDLKDAIAKHTKAVHIEPTLDAAYKYLASNTKPGDLLITMGAGDTWQLAERLVGSK